VLDPKRPFLQHGRVTDAARGLVLVVEDEPAIADLQRLYLTREGFSVQVLGTGEEALDAIKRLRPVAVIMDVGLPGMDGTEVVRRLRGAGDDTPVLFVTARDEEVDRVLGLEIGGDDYITKPFSPREVVARVRTVLRRGRLPVVGEPLVVGEVRLLPDERRIEVAGQDVEFTATEFDLLAHLMRHPGRVFSREELLSEVWGYGPVVTTRTVDVHVAQVRAKLGPALRIRTVRGVGYGVER
jgi:DNA-binding response OmpR family regulator